MSDEIKRFFDNGRAVLLFANDNGSYTARPLTGSYAGRIIAMTSHVSDDSEATDFEPSLALYRLAEKALPKASESVDSGNA